MVKKVNKGIDKKINWLYNKVNKSIGLTGREVIYLRNKELYDKAVADSGLKKRKICEMLGLSRQGLWLKEHDKVSFTDEEEDVLCLLLRIHPDERSLIF